MIKIIRVIDLHYNRFIFLVEEGATHPEIEDFKDKVQANFKTDDNTKKISLMFYIVERGFEK